MRASQKALLYSIGVLIVAGSLVPAWALLAGSAAFDGPGWWIALALVCGAALGLLVTITVAVLARYGPGSVQPGDLARIRSLRPETTAIGVSVPLFTGRSVAAGSQLAAVPTLAVLVADASGLEFWGAKSTAPVFRTGWPSVATLSTVSLVVARTRLGDKHADGLAIGFTSGEWIGVVASSTDNAAGPSLEGAELAGLLAHLQQFPRGRAQA